MPEEWRVLPDANGKYQVSSLGRVRGVKGEILSTPVGKQGYRRVTVLRVRRYLHHCIALAFLGPRPPGAHIRHLNGDKADCRVSNLAYGTPRQNAADKLRHGKDANARKTHCKQGHELTPDNIYRTKARPNSRQCRTCCLRWQRESRARKLAYSQT